MNTYTMQDDDLDNVADIVMRLVVEDMISKGLITAESGGEYWKNHTLVLVKKTRFQRFWDRILKLRGEDPDSGSFTFVVAKVNIGEHHDG